MASDQNVVALIGRLTRDAEQRTLPSGAVVLDIRLAFTRRVKRGEEWLDESNYVDVSHFARSEKLAGYLTRGKQIAVRGELRFREWEAPDGSKRNALDVLAQDVQLLGGESLEATPAGGASVQDDSIPFGPSIA